VMLGLQELKLPSRRDSSLLVCNSVTNHG
jgi:hypothetical protein